MKKDALKFEVLETIATKVTITISRRQLWRNFVETWSEIAWDDYRGVEILKETADVLCCKDSLQQIRDKVCGLFRDGSTFLMMGDAMMKLDVVGNDKLLREIIVTDKVGDKVEMIVIRHEDINF